MKNDELIAFLRECGYGTLYSTAIANVLSMICRETYKYNKLVGILNEIRLESNAENESNVERDDEGGTGPD